MNKLTLLPDCARCGEAHADLERKPFTRSSPVEGYDYFSICPETQEPILIRKRKFEAKDPITGSTGHNHTRLGPLDQDQEPKQIPKEWIDQDPHFRAGEREAE